ncbi:MAG: hypothetical protein LBR64_08390 [Dysgonamonadaceae bacterium]|jgi:hypothetical protein|nr:hypothetical protein [Dysgonamonadaceae bacterium]
MARPITDTPTLRGIEALRFMERMENVKKISARKRKEMNDSYRLFKQRATFAV